MAKPIPEILAFVLLAWLASLAAAMLIAMYRGQIGMNGIFATDLDGDGYADEFHVERVQLLLISLIGIGSYAFVVLKASTAAGTSLAVMPDVPEELVMLLGASNTLFLTGKFSRTLTRG
jgi:hypothetical protein